jgi:alpha-tubulin suppressor-like RCC1 family protein
MSCVRTCTQRTDCASDGTCTIASGASIGVCTDLRAIDAGGVTDAPVDAGGSCTPLGAQHVCTGEGFACAIRLDGSVVCWGAADTGQTGNPAPTTSCQSDSGTRACALAPVAVSLEEGGALMNAAELGCGRTHACARTTDGHVRCWGRNFVAMLGAPTDGIVGARLVVDSGGVGIGGFTSLTVGDDHSCGLRGTSRAMCWGANDYGELARGTMTTTGELAADATSVLTASPLGAIVALANDTCVVDGTQHVQCLGDNTHAQLGVAFSVTPQSSTLRTIGSLVLDATTPVLSGGNDFACALDTMGHVQCWGQNGADSLGLGSTVHNDQSAPTPLYGSAATTTFIGIFDGPMRLTTCATTANGDMWCWGDNNNGQLARDTASVDWDAARVVGVPPMLEGHCSDRACCAVTMAHEAWCWGANDIAQLGRGHTSAIDWHPAPVCAP